VCGGDDEEEEESDRSTSPEQGGDGTVRKDGRREIKGKDRERWEEVDGQGRGTIGAGERERW
jgi:hypothetical protein